MEKFKTSLLLLLATSLITLGALLLTKPGFTQSELPDI
jgi:hypothetical protein